MTREMLIKFILDSAINGTLKEVNDAIDLYCREKALAFYEFDRGIPSCYMDNSYDHFLESLNLKA